jgi:hypothetical protein
MAICHTQDVTWEEGVMDVFGVISICCAKAVPARSPNNRTEVAATQPNLEIRCRPRTMRILAAAFRRPARTDATRASAGAADLTGPAM